MSEVNEGAERLGKRRFWAIKKKRESVCDDRSKLIEVGADAHYPRENPGEINDSYEWLEGLRWPHFNGYNHYRVFEFVRGKSHVKGIECFWSYVKRRFAKFNGLTDVKFILHLKESECRFNPRNDNFVSFVERTFLGKIIKDTSLEPNVNQLLKGFFQRISRTFFRFYNFTLPFNLKIFYAYLCVQNTFYI